MSSSSARRFTRPASVVQAVAGLAAGRSSVQVASELEIARSTVVSAARRFGDFGVDGLYDRRRHNGSRKVDEAFRRRSAEMLRVTPEEFGWRRPTWTRELLCLQAKRQGWPPVAVCTMGRALAIIGARIDTPKPVVLCPSPRDERLRRLAQIRALEARATAVEPVLYADEIDIHLNPKLGRDRMSRGQQRRLVTPGKNENFYLAGALDVRSGALHTTGGARKSAALFCELLRLLARTYARARRRPSRHRQLRHPLRSRHPRHARSPRRPRRA
ncbi:MAG: helix-turn-helix domain-containing protein [Sorangiineae bacterium]|nr:helix-turn-helix domain-containing protein [Polyangiaceae bacterium]MEB2324648.1 helix-turn-helix domain-containing protein [Sorangiineae bacterium]